MAFKKPTKQKEDKTRENEVENTDLIPRENLKMRKNYHLYHISFPSSAKSTRLLTWPIEIH